MSLCISISFHVTTVSDISECVKSSVSLGFDDMPVERQAERLATPLSRRDKRFLLAAGVVAALAILAGILYVALRDGSRTGESCFTATFAASVGGATVHYCGAAAVHYCRVNARGSKVAEACRRAGFAVGATP